MVIPLRQLEPLSEHNLVNCTDDRTREFAMALIDFAVWDLGRIYGSVEAGLLKEQYQWPSYILNLVSRPRDWSAWRTGVEKKGFKDKVSKRRMYLTALQDEYVMTSEAEDFLNSTTTSSEDLPDDLSVSQSTRRAAESQPVVGTDSYTSRSLDGLL